MDHKMKNFDRNIEQMMNENAVTPPFGAWNRIAAELDAEVIVASTAAATAPAKRNVAGMVISAMVIGASFVTAYFVNSNTLQQPVATKATVTTPSVIAPAVSSVPITEQPVIAVNTEAKQIAVANRTSKSKSATTPAQEYFTPITESGAGASHSSLPSDVEVLVPLMAIDNNSPATETYYFPAVDMYTGENKMAESKTAAKVTKTEKAPEREVTSSSEPRIKFRPKKHNSYRYGKINRTHSRRK